eukprot:12892585-Prorocentrum_lima.AAC.1
MWHDLVRTRIRGRTVESTQSTHVIGGCCNTKIASFQQNSVSEAMPRRIENGLVQGAEKSTAVRKVIVISSLY